MVGTQCCNTSASKHPAKVSLTSRSPCQDGCCLQSAVMSKWQQVGELRRGGALLLAHQTQLPGTWAALECRQSVRQPPQCCSHASQSSTSECPSGCNGYTSCCTGYTRRTTLLTPKVAEEWRLDEGRMFCSTGGKQGTVHRRHRHSNRPQAPTGQASTIGCCRRTSTAVQRQPSCRCKRVRPQQRHLITRTFIK